MWSSIPKMGIGQRWDGESTERLQRYRGRGLDFIEPNLPLALGGLPSGMPIVTHSSELGLASTGPLNERMVENLAQKIHEVAPPWTGEHFALVSPWPTGDIGYNAAPILDSHAIDAGTRHVRDLQGRYGCPIALEAGPRYLDVCGWDDHGTILEISKATDCGILLDISHHLVSMFNLSRDPHDGLSPEVLERTVEVHITGLGRHSDGHHYHDFHGGPVAPEVWSLLEWALPRSPNLKAVTLEHDTSVPEADYARDLERLVRVTDAWRSS